MLGERLMGRSTRAVLRDGASYFLKVRITCACVSLPKHIKSVHFIFSVSSTLKHSVFRQIPIIVH